MKSSVICYLVLSVINPIQEVLASVLLKKIVLVGCHEKINAWSKLQKPRSAPIGVDRLEAVMSTLVLRVFQYS